MLRWPPLLALLVAFSAAAAEEEIVTLATRPDVTRSYLLSVPVSGKASAVAVLLAGGGGQVDLAHEQERQNLDRGNRLLLAHHVEDECRAAPYSEAQALAARYPLVSVSGSLPPQSAPCQAISTHGFLGREADTVRETVNWMLGRPFKKKIE